MKEVWLKATVIGSLWAAVEIILGSFLHNLRIPLAGSMLSFSSVVLMVAFLRMWPERGMIIRAALICALMKSISPSAVIIGPMTGILLEGILMESALFVFGLNRPAMIVGGMLAVFSAILHKAISLLFIYGLDLLVLLENLYNYSIKQIGLETLSPWVVLLLLTIIYLLFGLLAVILGFQVPQPDQTSSRSGRRNFEQKGPGLFEYSDPGKYSLLWLIFIFVALIAVLLVMNNARLWISVLVSLGFLSFLFMKYNRATRPITRPKFWIQFALVTILAAMFIKGIDTGKLFSMDGLRTGLELNLRALVVLTSFTAIGVELKNPLIKTLLYKKGLAALYSALNMAFATLPAVISHLPALKGSLRRLRSIFVEFFQISVDLFWHFKSMTARMPHTILVSGNRETGKTSLLSELAEQITGSGISVGGFLAIGIHSGTQRTGYGLQSLPDGRKAGFCTSVAHPGWERIGRYYIDPKGASFGHEVIQEAIGRAVKVIIIDEVGPLEMRNRGWANDILELGERPDIIQVWAVRERLLEKITRKWPLRNYQVVNAPESDAQSLLHRIKKLV